MNYVNFWADEKRNLPEERQDNTLYFVTDAGELYKGSTPIANNLSYTLSGALSEDKNSFINTLTSSTGDKTSSTIPTMTGATSSVDGAIGLVPLATNDNYTQFLRGDGTWQTPTNTVPSAYCSTGATTAAKAATCSGYALLKNSYLHVIITTSNTKQSKLTLNVNKKGAKSIYINGAVSSATNYALPAGSYLVYYDGTNYHFRTDGLLPASISGNAATATKAVNADSATNANIAKKVEYVLKFGNKAYDGSAEQIITAADLGLSSALKYMGPIETLESVTNPQSGDVYSLATKNKDNSYTLTGKEMVYVVSDNFEGWIELGDEQSYALKTINISAGDDLTGGGNLTTNRTIGLPNRLKKTQANNEKLSDANNALTSGFHYISGATTNRPAFNQASDHEGTDYRILTTAHSDNWLQQIATDFRCNDIFYRRRDSGTWKPWVQIQTTESADARYVIKSGDTMAGPLNITGGDSATAGKIALLAASSGQITDANTSTLFGFLSNNTTDLTIGSTGYHSKIRGTNVTIGSLADVTINPTSRAIISPTGNAIIKDVVTISGTKMTTSVPTEITGTLTLSKTQDAAGKADNGPALIVGGTATTAHIEMDNNEILAKSNGTTPTTLNLNTDGGAVVAGGAFTATSLKSNGALTIGGSITYLNGDYTDKTIVQLWTGDNNSCGIAIGGGGPVIIGGGESANSYKTDTSLSATSEEATYITADKSIYFFPNCDTIANRVGAIFDTSRNFYPIAKDKSKANNTGSLGLSDARWNTGYFKTLNTSGGITNSANGIANTGNITQTTGHIYLTGSSASSSTSNTTQIVMGTSNDQHIALSANNNCFVINPNTSTSSPQIALYLDETATSKIPGSLNLGKAIAVGTNASIGGTLNVANKTTITCAHTTTDALSVTGGAKISNTLRIGTTNSNPALDGNWCEGIRINAADNQWVTIALGATGETNANTHMWSIHRTNTNDFNISKNSSDGLNGLVMTGTGMGLGTASPTHRLHIVGDVKTEGTIYLERNKGTHAGKINFWRSDYKTWVEYMAPPTAGHCPTGGQPVTYGDVTNYARRSLIENLSGYGWVWEASSITTGAASNTSDKPTAIMSLSSNTGKLAVAGAIAGATSISAGTSLSVGTTASITGLITQGLPASDASINSMNKFKADLFVEGNGSAPNEPVKPGFYLGKSTSDENRHMDIVSGGDCSYIDFNKASEKKDYQVRLIANVTNGLTEFQWGGGTDKRLHIAGDLSAAGGTVTPYIGDGSGYLAYVGGGTNRNLGDNQTGYLTIALPATAWLQTTMLKFKVSIYNYSTNTSVDYHIGVYTYNSGDYLYNPTAFCLGKKGEKLSNLPVRFGYQGNRYYIYIGDSNTNWNYPNVTISDVTVGHNASADTYKKWKEGWSISFGTSLASTIKHTISNTYIGYNAHNADYATNANYAASAGNADTVDGKHFHWSGQNGQPPWLWGGSDGTNMYVYNPSNFSVEKARIVQGNYTANGGQQNPNYFGTNTVGFLMMNTPVNGNSQYKDWIIMDCYAGNDVGGGVALGVNRQALGAYIMRSDAARTSWAQSAELLHTSNYSSYAIGRKDANGYAGMAIGNADNVWIRTTTQGIIPYQSGGAGSGHQSLGTSSWYFSAAYIDNIYGYLNGNISGSSTSCSGNAVGLSQSGYGNGNLTYHQTSSAHAGSEATWASYIICNHGNGSNYYNQTIRMPFWGPPQYSRMEGGTQKTWWTFLSTENYSSYVLPLTGGTLSNNLYLSATNKGYYLKDSTGYQYPGVYDNGSNLWFGSTATASQHHRGQTYISAGHNGTTGNQTIYISVPNAANNGGTNYAVLHAGNYTNHVHRISNSAVSGVDAYVTLVYDTNYYYMRPYAASKVVCGSIGYPWHKVYTERLAVTKEQIQCLPSYSTTTDYATNVYVGTSGIFSRSTKTSSRTVKHDIKNLENEDIKAENLYKINVCQFKYNEGVISEVSSHRYKKDLPGFIIEDLDEKYPIIIDKPSENVKDWSWNSQYLIPPMLQLIQDQKKQLDKQQEEIDELKELINKLLEKLS